MPIFDEKKRAGDGGWEITVQGGKVFSHNSIKFLGFYLKCNLDWEDEIKTVTKCENPIKIVKCETHTWWEGINEVNDGIWCILFHKLESKQLKKLEHWSSGAAPQTV